MSKMNILNNAYTSVVRKDQLQDSWRKTEEDYCFLHVIILNFIDNRYIIYMKTITVRK